MTIMTADWNRETNKVKRDVEKIVYNRRHLAHSEEELEVIKKQLYKSTVKKMLTTISQPPKRNSDMVKALRQVDRMLYTTVYELLEGWKDYLDDNILY